jgi:uncharacterized protein (TIGR00369 family)
MEIRTHLGIDSELCGKPLHIEEGFSRVELAVVERMKVDDAGLVHAGFIFGLADHAAMIAVNHPYVVLGAASVRFLKPVRVGDSIIAEAKVIAKEGRKASVRVEASRGDGKVFEGTFTCFSLDRHVLT